jgi:hypothetical protein
MVVTPLSVDSALGLLPMVLELDWRRDERRGIWPDEKSGRGMLASLAAAVA